MAEREENNKYGFKDCLPAKHRFEIMSHDSLYEIGNLFNWKNYSIWYQKQLGKTDLSDVLHRHFLEKENL